MERLQRPGPPYDLRRLRELLPNLGLFKTRSRPKNARDSLAGPFSLQSDGDQITTMEGNAIVVPRKPLLRSFTHSLTHGRLSLTKEALVFLCAYFIYMFTRNLVFQDGSEFAAFLNAERLIDFETKLLTLWEVVVQGWLMDNAKWILYVLNWIYIITFWPIIAVTGVVMFYTNRERYKTYRNIVLLTFALALIVFMLFPLAPPRLMLHHGFIDSISQFGPAFYDTREGQPYFNAFAAMPSLHFGWTLLLGVMFWRTGPRSLKMAAVLYPSLTFLAIVGTGNHYALDAVGGGAVALAAFLIHEGLIRRRRGGYKPA